MGDKFNLTVHPGQWVNLIEQQDGNLRIQALPSITDDDWQELEGLPTDDALDWLLEDHFHGGDCFRVSPETIGALTDAPILSFDPPDTTTKVYWHSNYQVEDPIQILREHHAITFQGDSTGETFEGESTKQSSQKVALDALLEELNNNLTTVDHRNDKEYPHPFGSKGTEPENVKHGSRVAIACFLTEDEVRAVGRGELDPKAVGTLVVGGVPLKELIRGKNSALSLEMLRAKGAASYRDKALLVVDMVQPVLDKYSKVYGASDTATRDHIFSICYNALKNSRVPSRFTGDTLALYDEPKRDEAAHEIGLAIVHALRGVVKMGALGLQAREIMHDDSGASTGLRRRPDYGESDSYTSKMNDANSKDAAMKIAARVVRVDSAAHEILRLLAASGGSMTEKALRRHDTKYLDQSPGRSGWLSSKGVADKYFSRNFNSNMEILTLNGLVIFDDGQITLTEKGRQELERLEPLAAQRRKRIEDERLQNAEIPEAEGYDQAVRAPQASSKTAAMCICGHPFNIHVHPPDFGCPHENDPGGGCGCKGATEKSASMKTAKYVELQVKNLLDRADEAKLKSMKSAEDAYDYLWDVHEQLIRDMHSKGFEEVGEVDPTDLINWCDNHYQPKPSGKVEAIAPPGWEGTVKEMKKEPDIDNPWALAWSMKNKGYHSHASLTIKKNALQLKDQSIEMHATPQLLPPRDDLRTHLDEETKKEVADVKKDVRVHKDGGNSVIDHMPQRGTPKTMEELGLSKLVDEADRRRREEEARKGSAPRMAHSIFANEDDYVIDEMNDQHLQRVRDAERELRQKFEEDGDVQEELIFLQQQSQKNPEEGEWTMDRLWKEMGKDWCEEYVASGGHI